MKQHLAAADALRAVAILAVFVHHTAKLGDWWTPGATHELTFMGTWGVDCFFVLTGFLLTQPFLHGIVDGGRFPSFKLFWLRRFLRIYPLYALCVVISAIDAGASGLKPSLGDVLTHLTFTHNFFQSYMGSLNGPLWTMALDAQFYAILPFVALATAAFGDRLGRESRIRFVWIVLGTIIVVSVLERVLATSILLRYSTVTFPQISFATRNIVGMASEFAIGTAIAFRVMLVPPAKLRPAASIAGLFLIAGLAIVATNFEKVDLNRVTLALGIEGTRDLLGGCVAAVALWGLLTLDVAWLERAIRSRVVAVAASLAYGVYLFHFPILQHVARLHLGRPGTPSGALLLGLVGFVASVLVAVVVHRTVEEPFLAMKERARDASGTMAIGEAAYTIPDGYRIGARPDAPNGILRM